MTTIRSLAIALAGIVATLPVFGEGLLKQPGEWVPFLERLEPNEFLAVEQRLDETLSDGANLVIYCASDRYVRASITLKRHTDGRYRLDVVADPKTAKPLRKTLLLPVELATKLQSALEFCLTTKLYPPTGKAFHYPDKRDTGITSYWVNLRVDESTSIAGVVLASRCGVGQESSSSFLSLMMQITQFAHEDRIEGKMLTDLDLAISALRRSYPVH